MNILEALAFLSRPMTDSPCSQYLLPVDEESQQASPGNFSYDIGSNPNPLAAPRLV
jgi:hypothetical protein